LRLPAASCHGFLHFPLGGAGAPSLPFFSSTHRCWMGLSRRPFCMRRLPAVFPLSPDPAAGLLAWFACGRNVSLPLMAFGGGQLGGPPGRFMPALYGRSGKIGTCFGFRGAGGGAWRCAFWRCPGLAPPTLEPANGAGPALFSRCFHGPNAHWAAEGARSRACQGATELRGAGGFLAGDRKLRMVWRA